MQDLRRMLFVGTTLLVLLPGSAVRAAGEDKAGSKGESKEVESKKEPKSLGSGWFSLGTTFVHTSGDSERFRKHRWTDDNFVYGLRGLEYTLKAGGWLTTLKGRSLTPDDYGVDAMLKKKNVGWLQVYFDQFPSYYDSGSHYYAFAPFVHSLGKNLTIRRRQMGVNVAWTPKGGPNIILRLNRWERTGAASTLWGGQVVGPANYTTWSYPQYSDVEQRRNRIGLEASKKFGRFNFDSGVRVQDFRGRNKVTGSRFDLGGALSQTRLSRYEPDFTEVNPYVGITGDLIKNVLRLEFAGQYSYTRTGGTFDEDAFDPAGLPTSEDHAHNFIANRHKGNVNMALVNTRLVYTPNKKTTIFAGVGLKYQDADHRSIENEDTDDVPDGVLDETWRYDTDENRRVWMGNLGAQHRILPWLIAKAEGKWEHSDLQRNWQGLETLGGDGSYQWRTDGYLDRVNFGASLTARPIRQLKLIGRWRQTVVDNDWHDKIDTRNGAPAETRYPGIIGDNGRRVNEWSAMGQYKPCQYLWATYKLAFRTTDYSVAKEPAEEIGNWRTMVNCLSVSVMPVDGLTVTASGWVQDFDTRTRGIHHPTVRVPAFSGNTCTWALEADYALTKKINLSAGFSRTAADSVYDFNHLDTFVGVDYRINDSWSVDCRYTYMQFDEGSTGNTNDYTGSIFSVGLVGRFK